MNATKRRTTASLFSTALFALAAVLFVIVAVLYFRDRGKDDEIPPPPVLPGRAELKNVFDVLEAKGLEVEYARSGGARIAGVSQPGQPLIVEGTPLYVFIFENPDDREAETVDLDASTLVLLDTGGTPVAGGALHAVGGSNIYAVLVGGGDDIVEKLDEAIGGLPTT